MCILTVGYKKNKKNNIMKNTDKIYQIGNFIAAQASDNIPNIGPLLYYIFCKSFMVNSTMMRSNILPLICAIEEELIAFEEVTNILEIHSEVLDDFKEKFSSLISYEFWESIDSFIECAWILFGTKWSIVTIRGD